MSTTDAKNEPLAIEGGPRACPDPWPPRRLFGAEEKQAAIDLFDRSIAAGEAFGYGGVEEVEYGREFAAFMGGGFADGVNSGTNAVYVALRALAPEPFTEVIIPPITDPGGAMPVPMMNCIPIPADAAPGTFNIGAEQIAARITSRTSAIIVAHIAGLPCDMDPIMSLARERGIPVLEDCAQSHGALYKGRPVGSIGDVAAFSLMFGKHHACGGQGGMVFTRNEEIYWRGRRAADRGKPFGLTGASGNVVASLNCNMDELHAAIGRAQLRKLPGIVARRRDVAARLSDACRGQLASVRVMDALPQSDGAPWFLFMRLNVERLTVDKARFVAALEAEGLPVGASYLHVPSLQKWFQERSVFGRSGYPWASSRYTGDASAVYEVPNVIATEARHFRLMIHEGWGDREVEATMRALRKVERAYARPGV
jgi:dTDP-4-amino-4,6-dideoxygalactose transaminase